MNQHSDVFTHVPIRPLLSNEHSSAAATPDDGQVNGNAHVKHVETAAEETSESDEEEAGVRNAKVKRGPKEPTEKEIVEHNATHVPYRSWCPHCVAAAGKATPHSTTTTDTDEKCVPCLHTDYWFMRDGPGTEATPVIVLRDDDTKAYGAHVVTVKGSVDWVAEKIHDDIEKMGHFGKITLKSDQEPALKDLVLEVQKVRAGHDRETLLEESKVYDSQSNGTAERAVQSIECIVRTHKLALERKINKKIPSKHPIMSWLVEHGADVLNKYHVNKSGRTAYEMIRGKPYNGEMFEFGRRVFHRYPGKTQGGSMKERWGTGIFLGKLWKSDECMIFNEDGNLVKTRSIKLMTQEESWVADEVEKVSVSRWKAQFATATPLEEKEDEDGEEPVARTVQARDFSITKQLIEVHGYSEDCGRCRALGRGKSAAGTHHTKACRERFRKLVLESDDHAAVDRATHRQNQFIAEQLEEKNRSAVNEGSGDPGSSNRGGDFDSQAPQQQQQQSQAPARSAAETAEVEAAAAAIVPDPDLEVAPKRPHESQAAVRPRDDPEFNENEGVPSAKKLKRQKDESKREAKRKEKEKQSEEKSNKRRKEEKEDEQNFEDFFDQELLMCEKNVEKNKIWNKDWMKKNPLNNKDWNIEEKIVQKKIFHLMFVHKPKVMICEAVEKFSKGYKDPVKVNQFLSQACKLQKDGGRKFVVTMSLSAPRWVCSAWNNLKHSSNVRHMGVHLQNEQIRVITNSNTVVENIVASVKDAPGGNRSHNFEEFIEKGIDLEAVPCQKKMLNMITNYDKLHSDPIGEYIDDNTGDTLNIRDTAAARKLEMETFEKMGVYEYVRREVAIQDTNGKIVGVRWVDVQKGPIVRSRLVAQEFAGKEEREDIFAATPPLFATKVVISDAASQGDLGQGERTLMIVDVKTAFLYGEIDDRVYIELPKEDQYSGREYVGLLRKAMYGTRGAPKIWQRMVKKVMNGLGFNMNPIHPCVFHHPTRNILVVTHVDDFLCSGDRGELRWLARELEKEFVIKHEILGNRAGESHEGQFLGRSIRRVDKGFEYEGNTKHVKILLDEWNLENARPLSSPGSAAEKPSLQEKSNEETLLNSNEARLYRRAAARINYMALDRADLSFASKELSRGMARPTQGDVVRLKRVLRYLKNSPRACYLFEWQSPVRTLIGMADSDWAGCTKTRKSSSGGVLMYGRHTLLHWSSTQSVISLSSAEAELNATVKMTSEALGVKNMFQEIGKDMKLVVQTDSSACSGILHREGCGKVKHLETRQLWVQGYVSNKVLDVQKIPRDINASDCLTHHWSAADGHKHFEKIGLIFK